MLTSRYIHKLILVRIDVRERHQSKSASKLKATHPLGIKVLVATVWHTGHPLVLVARTSNANTSATKHGLALLRVLKSLTLLLLLCLLLHHLRYEFSDLVCRDTKTTKIRERDIVLYSDITVAS